MCSERPKSKTWIFSHHHSNKHYILSQDSHDMQTSFGVISERQEKSVTMTATKLKTNDLLLVMSGIVAILLATATAVITPAMADNGNGEGGDNDIADCQHDKNTHKQEGTGSEGDAEFHIDQLLSEGETPVCP
jgi:hypothetical protein